MNVSVPTSQPVKISDVSGKLLELHASGQVGHLRRCLLAGAPLDKIRLLLDLLARLPLDSRPGPGGHLFIEAAFTAIYRTGGQSSRYKVFLISSLKRLQGSF